MLQDTNAGNINQVVLNPDAWFPDVNIQDWQEAYRVPGTAPQVLERQLVIAFAEINRRLTAWKEQQEEAGEAELPAATLTDYQEAVYARAFALLIPVLPSVLTDERAREDFEATRQEPSVFYDRSDAAIRRITAAGGGAGRVRAVVI